jgi:uncharacterized protein YjiS (DUF1127 family)
MRFSRVSLAFAYLPINAGSDYVQCNIFDARNLIMLALILEKLNAFVRYRRSMRELAKLSDRELSDIGLHRGNIESAAWSASRA